MKENRNNKIFNEKNVDVIKNIGEDEKLGVPLLFIAGDQCVV